MKGYKTRASAHKFETRIIAAQQHAQTLEPSGAERRVCVTSVRLPLRSRRRETLSATTVKLNNFCPSPPHAQFIGSNNHASNDLLPILTVEIDRQTEACVCVALNPQQIAPQFFAPRARRSEKFLLHSSCSIQSSKNFRILVSHAIPASQIALSASVYAARVAYRRLCVVGVRIAYRNLLRRARAARRRKSSSLRRELACAARVFRELRKLARQLLSEASAVHASVP